MQIGYYHIQNLYVNQQFNNVYVYAKPKHCVIFFLPLIEELIILSQQFEIIIKVSLKD